MTAEQKTELSKLEPVWQHWFNHFYINDFSQVIALNGLIYEITGTKRNLNCSDCVADLMKTAKNLYNA